MRGVKKRLLPGVVGTGVVVGGKVVGTGVVVGGGVVGTEKQINYDGKHPRGGMK